MGNADLPSLKSRAVVSAFTKLGYNVAKSRGKGSHVVMKCAGRPTLTVPQQRDVKRALLAGLIRTSGFTQQQFKDSL